LKLTRVLLVLGLSCVALLSAALPITTIDAQNPTPTPRFVVITATPSGGSAPAVQPTATPGGAATPAGGSSETVPVSAATADPDRPLELRVLDVARAYLQPKLGKNLRYVDAWTWELMLFPDSALGCPKEGETAIPGEAAGYRITIKPIGDPNTYEVRISYDLSTVFDCGIAGTVGAGQPVAPGSLPPPVSGSASGGGFELGGQIMDWNQGTIDKMRSAEMKWVKRQLRYGDGSGPAIIQAVKAQGFKILLSVVGKPEDVLVPGFYDQYAAFVGNLAASGADAIEVWNEQNIDREWPNGQISPANYVQLLAKSYNAIKSANPGTMVISGAPAPTGAAGAGGKTAAFWNDDVYMQEMAAAGAGQYADCIGVHYNEGIVSPRQSSGDPRDNYPTRYFSTMLQRAIGPFPGKPACFTELGYLSPEGYGTLPAGFAWAQNTTLAQHAQWLAEAAVVSAQSGRVRMMIIFNVDFTFFGTDPMAGFAIIRPGGACPACTQLAAVMP
jgi:hypothetical protein